MLYFPPYNSNYIIIKGGYIHLSIYIVAIYLYIWTIDDDVNKDKDIDIDIDREHTSKMMSKLVTPDTGRVLSCPKANWIVVQAKADVFPQGVLFK